jgi:hypothetical protein
MGSGLGKFGKNRVMEASSIVRVVVLVLVIVLKDPTWRVVFGFKR